MIREFDTQETQPSITDQRAEALVAFWDLEAEGATREETRDARDALAALGGTDPESSRAAIAIIEARQGVAQALEQ